MSDRWIDRPRRIKGSNDHDWVAWEDTPLGQGRQCKRCGCIDDGYVQPCIGTVAEKGGRDGPVPEL